MPRLATVSAGLQTARSNRLPTAVPVRSPPYEARASPRPRSRATREVTFRVDQVLRRHSQEIPALWKFGERESLPNASRGRSLFEKEAFSSIHEIVTK